MPYKNGELAYAEKVMLVTAYILREKHITPDDVMRITGLNRRSAYRILVYMDRVLCVYQEGRRRVLIEE